jgi:hypothetical protein
MVGGMTVVLPLLRNGGPRMLHPHVVPPSRDWVSEAYRRNREDGQNAKPMHG